MYRFALRPAWLLSHLLALVLVVAFVSLGLWQLDRLDQRRELNATIEVRTEEPVASVDGLDAEPGSLRFRTVTARGTYLDDQQFLVDNRSRNGLPGAWVVTPLDTGETVVAVNRGFVGFRSDGTLVAPEPPNGEVQVTGYVETSAERSCGSRTGPDGDLLAVACLDLDTVADETGLALAPFALTLQSSTPPAGELPVTVPPPELDEGPHLGYAIQWFLFAAIGVIGYPLILRRVARDRAAEGDESDEADEGDQGDELDRELRALLESEGRAGPHRAP